VHFSVTFWQMLQLIREHTSVLLQINKTADLAHIYYWPWLCSLVLRFCFLCKLKCVVFQIFCFLLQMYETRLLPHESDQITVSILLTNQSSSVIKELVFSMCNTPAVSLLRAVSNVFDLILCTNFLYVFQVNHKLHRLRAPFTLYLCNVCLVEVVMW
jgi:hypothetical protein